MLLPTSNFIDLTELHPTQVMKNHIYTINGMNQKYGTHGLIYIQNEYNQCLIIQHYTECDIDLNDEWLLQKQMAFKMVFIRNETSII